MSIPDGLEPVAAWGPHTPHWVDANVNEKIAWVKQHIPRHQDALNGTFYLIDGKPVMLVRYFARNNDGRKYHDPASGRPALEPGPVIVPLSGLPPAHLLR